MPAEDQIIIEFSGVDASQQGLTDYLKGVEEELLSIGKNNPQFLKGAIQGIKETTAELGKQAIAAGEDKKKVDFLVGSLNNLAKGVAGGAAKQATAEFQKFGNSVTATAKESEKLTTQLRRLRDEIVKLPEGSARFTELSIEAAKLQDKIGDVGERIRVLSSDTFAIDAVVDGVRGLTAAFTIAQSASALFGEENEDLQKALLKVQAATGLLIGVQEISQQLTGQGAAKVAILKGATAAYTFVTNGATVATRIFNAALLATVGGAVIAGIIALVANWDKLTGAISEADKKAQELRENQLKGIAAASRNRQAILAAEGKQIFDEREVQLKAELAQLTQARLRIEREEKATSKLVLDAKQDVADKRAEIEVNAIERENFIRQQGLRFIIDLRKAQASIETDYSRARLAAEIRVLEAEKDLELDAARDSSIKRTEIELRFLQNVEKLRLEFARKNAGSEINFKPDNTSVKKLAEDLVKQLEDEIAKLRIRIDPKPTTNAFAKTRDALLASEQKAAAESKASREAYQQAAIDSTQTTFDTIFTISNESRRRREEEELASLQRQEDKELESVQRLVDSKTITTEQGRAREEAINAKYREKEKQIKIQAFNADKQAKIAQAIINGALALTNVLANMQDPTVVQAFKIAAIATNSLAIASQIAIIAAQKPPAFKKGTRSAPGGMALVGEEGAELMHVPQGARIVPHAETMKVLSGHPDTDAILSRFNIPVTSARVGSMRGELKDFDFNRFESIISRHSQKSEVHVDKNGVITIVSNGLNEREYYGNRYSFK